MEEDGTGGGLFRYLYSRFLKEAGELLEIEELEGLSQRYHQIGQKWTNIAKNIRQAPKKLAVVNEASTILREVAKEETEVLSSLARIFE
jgi:hypothetical protein